MSDPSTNSNPDTTAGGNSLITQMFSCFDCFKNIWSTFWSSISGASLSATNIGGNQNMKGEQTIGNVAVDSSRVSGAFIDAHYVKAGNNKNEGDKQTVGNVTVKRTSQGQVEEILE